MNEVDDLRLKARLGKLTENDRDLYFDYIQKQMQVRDKELDLLLDWEQSVGKRYVIVFFLNIVLFVICNVLNFRDLFLNVCFFGCFICMIVWCILLCYIRKDKKQYINMILPFEEEWYRDEVHRRKNGVVKLQSVVQKGKVPLDFTEPSKITNVSPTDFSCCGDSEKSDVEKEKPISVEKKTECEEQHVSKKLVCNENVKREFDDSCYDCSGDLKSHIEENLATQASVDSLKEFEDEQREAELQEQQRKRREEAQRLAEERWQEKLKAQWWRSFSSVISVGQDHIYRPTQIFDMRSNHYGHVKKIDFEGCYVLYNKTKEMYYVGQSKTVLARVSRHFKGKGNGDVYADFKYHDEFEVCLIRLAETKYIRLNDLERELIRATNAYYNGYNSTNGNL